MTRYKTFAEAWDDFRIRFVVIYAVVMTSVGAYNGWFGFDSVPQIADDAARGAVGFPAFHLAANYGEANRARWAILTYQTAAFVAFSETPSADNLAAVTNDRKITCNDGSRMNVLREHAGDRTNPDVLRVSCEGHVYQLNDVSSADEVAARASVAIPTENSQDAR